MAKSLTETAKKILMKESDDPTPDRDAKNMNPNMATLRPASKNPEGPFANPDSMAPDGDETEDLGPAVVSPNDPGWDASKKMSKDSSRSAKSSVPAEKPTEQAAIMEDEEYEISEELEAFINEMIEEGYSEEEIAEAIEENFEFVTEEKDDEDEDEEKEEKKEEKMDESVRVTAIKEHVDALLSGENLSEEFRAKAETIFESAVRERVDQEISVLEEAYEQTLAQEVEKYVDELSEQLNSYLNYVVEEWVKANEVAIETGLRTEITEEFIGGLRTLFAENYIDIPDGKMDVVESLASRLEETEQKLNEQIQTNVRLTESLNVSKKEDLITSVCEGLTDTEADKLTKLAENIDFTSEEEFGSKLTTLRESYFPNTVKAPKELDNIDSADFGEGGQMIAEELQGPMAAYVKTLGKRLPK